MKILVILLAMTVTANAATYTGLFDTTDDGQPTTVNVLAEIVGVSLNAVTLLFDGQTIEAIDSPQIIQFDEADQYEGYITDPQLIVIQFPDQSLGLSEVEMTFTQDWGSLKHINDSVLLIAVPEPTAALGLLGLLPVAMRRKR